MYPLNYFNPCFEIIDWQVSFAIEWGTVEAIRQMQNGVICLFSSIRGFCEKNLDPIYRCIYS